MMTIRTALACTLAALVFAACTTRQSAPVVERSGGIPTAPAAPAAAPAAAPQSPDFYTVKRGDTLYSIALDNGQDYREVAGWNNITNPNVIQVGQVLRVRPPGAPAGSALPDSGVVVRPITPPGGVVAMAPGAGAPAAGGLKTEPNGAKRPYSEEALAQAQRETRTAVATAPAAAAAAAAAAAVPAAVPAAKPADSDDIAWAWPAGGKVIGNFIEGGANKGVDIAAKVGEPVLAAAPGKVVYSGQGLRGYGRLIIIKHNNDFLSAYAHNSNLLVKEGQPVTRGQKIAEAGNTDSDVPKLHFEIRRQGKPVDPTKYLPNR